MGTLIFWIIVGFCIFLFNREDCSKSVVKSKRRKATIVSNFPVDEDKKGWFKTREKVFEKYGRCCSMCGSEQNVEVHHIIPIREGGTNELENLIPLCRDCHQEIHHFVFGGNSKNISSKYGQYTQKKNKFKKGFLLLQAIKHKYRLKIKYETHKLHAGIEENIRIIRPEEIKLGYQMTDNEFIMNAQYRKEPNLVFVIAFCEMRQAKRIFRLDRMEILEVIKN